MLNAYEYQLGEERLTQDALLRTFRHEEIETGNSQYTHKSSTNELVVMICIHKLPSFREILFNNTYYMNINFMLFIAKYYNYYENKINAFRCVQ